MAHRNPALSAFEITLFQLYRVEGIYVNPVVLVQCDSHCSVGRDSELMSVVGEEWDF